MTRLSLFNSPLLLGFDQFERTLDRVTKTSPEGYPPYNIEQTSKDDLRITLAVAGFSEDNLSVHVEENQLIIQGRQDDDKEKVYLHRGIAARQFQRTFVLAEGIKVTSAEINNGLLNIDLTRPKPEVRVQKINIRSAPPKSARRTSQSLDFDVTN
ncbi:Hsp20 family protein [Ponticaulis sp.]|uniref:Hsp20 family protein n=1 Tax=Ponticaulis sp. TaxID=2020902 RepID=UPI000C4D4B17|nr:Hsp20 family protein [Ponticaulis sp.]MBN06136.1 heat-shock protein Hsp20 [Ponticaulis sp.]|tara:strand:+ start:260 stop:724 length:465 start_codon:yes stop_codon:yes gene_type:complete